MHQPASVKAQAETKKRICAGRLDAGVRYLPFWSKAGDVVSIVSFCDSVSELL